MTKPKVMSLKYVSYTWTKILVARVFLVIKIFVSKINIRHRRLLASSFNDNVVTDLLSLMTISLSL